MRFSRPARLTHAREFSQVFAKPYKSGDACWLVLGCKNSQAGARLGMAISKKNVPRAVARNRLKRLVRESFRAHRQPLGNQDLVVMARRGADRKDNAELIASLQRHWKKITQVSSQ